MEYSDSTKITFDCWMYTCDGFISSVDIILANDCANTMGVMGDVHKSDPKKSTDLGSNSRKNILEFHEELGHPSSEITKLILVTHNVTLTGEGLDKFKSCVLTKVC